MIICMMHLIKNKLVFGGFRYDSFRYFNKNEKKLKNYCCFCVKI